MSIKAGDAYKFSRDPDEWIFVDLGFSGRRSNGTVQKSTGLKLPGEDSRNCTWSEAIDRTKSCLANIDKSIYMMLEAPLSVAFSKEGHPVPRVFEKNGTAVRYWYMQSGAVVLISAFYFLQHLRTTTKHTVNLYESFISFKKGRTEHYADCDAMKKAILNNQKPITEFTQKPEDTLECITKSTGWDFGVPPVFCIDPKG